MMICSKKRRLTAFQVDRRLIKNMKLVENPITLLFLISSAENVNIAPIGPRRWAESIDYNELGRSSSRFSVVKIGRVTTN